MAGFPKDAFHFYRSQWTAQPVLHLLPHWTHPLVEPGTKIPVVAYSNCDEVELIVNGESRGRRAMERNSHLQWDVLYMPGYIEAVGFKVNTAKSSAVCQQPLRNVTADGPFSQRSVMGSDNPAGRISHVTFENVRLGGKLVTSAADLQLDRGIFVIRLAVRINVNVVTLRRKILDARTERAAAADAQR